MIKLYEEPGNGFVSIRYDSDLPGWMLHMDSIQWSPETYKRYLNIWDTYILPKIREMGISVVYGLPETKLDLKFNIMFGMLPTNLVVTTTDGMDQILTKRVL